MKYAKPVKINDIVELIDARMDGWNLYYNKKTGEFLELYDEILGVAEEFDEEDLDQYDDWDQKDILKAVDFLKKWNDYIELPDKFEINEYRIMERFCYEIEDERLQEELCYAISGRGAFRRFKDAIYRYNLEDSWYSYKHRALCNVAKNWCEINEIPFMEE